MTIPRGIKAVFFFCRGGYFFLSSICLISQTAVQQLFRRFSQKLLSVNQSNRRIKKKIVHTVKCLALMSTQLRNPRLCQIRHRSSLLLDERRHLPVEQASMLGIASSKPLCFSTKWNRHIYSVTSCDKNFLKDGDRTKLKLT